MRILVLSDIHGNIDVLNKVIDNEYYDNIIFLGDMYGYHELFSGEEVKNKLYSLNAIMVRGNCDNVLPLNIPEIMNFKLNNITFTITHGHKYNQLNNTYNQDILLLGHTHVGMINNVDNYIIANPGSIAKPRDGSLASYIIIDDNYITLKSIDKKIIKEVKYK